MKWMQVRDISDIVSFIRYDDIDYITIGKDGILTTIRMKNGKKIHLNKVDAKAIRKVLEDDK